MMQHNFNKHTYCTLPWSSIEIMPTGDYKVCMFFGNKSNKELSDHNDMALCLDDNGNTMNVLTHSIEDVINSKYHKEVRLAHSKNERHIACKTCWDREDANARYGLPYNSVRFYKTFIQFQDVDGSISIDDAPNIMKEDGSIDNTPVSLDLRFTNVCNMKCVMCSPTYSNMWYEDWTIVTNDNTFTLGNKTYTIRNDNGTYKSDIVPWHDSEKWFNEFDKIKHRIRHIYITGGESFLIKGHDVILDKLIDSDYAKNVVLEYDTNLSIINDKILNKLSKFKKIILRVSCDDTFEQYDLIRFPGNFNTLVKNLEIVKEKGMEVYEITMCLGIHSLFSPLRLYNYFGDDQRYVIRFLSGPHPQDIAYLPDEVKLKVIQMYANSNYTRRWKEYIIAYLQNNINVHTYEECLGYTKKFINYMNKLDEIRGTNWKKVFPEVYQLIAKYEE